MSDLAQLTEADQYTLTVGVGALVLASADRDEQTCQVLLLELGDRFGCAGPWLVACSLAETIQRVLDLAPTGDAYLCLRVEDNRGRQIEPEDAPPEEASRVWAGRFVVAWGNGHVDTCRAFFDAVPQHRSRNIAALVRMAGGAARQRETTDGRDTA